MQFSRDAYASSIAERLPIFAIFANRGEDRGIPFVGFSPLAIRDESIDIARQSLPVVGLNAAETRTMCGNHVSSDDRG
jgi:hypothetical protein